MIKLFSAPYLGVLEVSLLLTIFNFLTFFIADDDKVIKLCSAPCLGAYKFGNNLTDAFPCDLCGKDCQMGKGKNGKPMPKKVIYYSGKSNRYV